MSREPMSLEEQTEVLLGIVLSFAHALSRDQREEVVRLLRTHADLAETPARAGALLRQLADAVRTHSRKPTQH